MNPAGYLRWFLIALLVLVFVAGAALGLQWRLLEDSPLLHYVAFLINEHGFVAYRDVFETSLPGTFLVHMAIGGLFGYGDLAFRLVDLAWLLTLLSMTWLVIRRIDAQVAWISCLGFGIAYLAFGQAMAMQRDYLGLLPITLALLIAGDPRRSALLVATAIGCLFAAAASIKLHLAIGLPAVFFYMIASRPEYGGLRPAELLVPVVQTGACAMVGFMFVLAMPLLWLWQTGGLGAFWEMLTRYLPLHVDMTGAIETVTPAEHFDYRIRKLIFGTRFFAPPALLGIVVALRYGQLQRSAVVLVTTLCALMVLYVVYAALGGKFWLYHWVPFRYFALICTALMLVPLHALKRPVIAESVLALVFLATLTVWVSLQGYTKQTLAIPPVFKAQVLGPGVPSPKGGKVDEIAAFLIDADLGPDDRVQPLDWTAGAVHAMLIAEVLPATPYIYDYYFYHYLSDPLIQEMRRRYIEGLEADLPRFMIDVQDKLRPKGLDTSDRFPELESILERHYVEVESGRNYRILELKD